MRRSTSRSASQSASLGSVAEGLSTTQSAALSYVAEHARSRAGEAAQKTEHVLRMSNITRERLEEAVSQLKSHARVALHFHPDRPGPGERIVAAALLAEGVYRSQFETHISNGGVSAYPGGARQRWEDAIFGGAYEEATTSAGERPKYGALDVMLHPDGPSPRFGSCYFLLAPSVSHRCTFTYLDSHENPDEKGTYAAFDDIMAALLDDVFASDFALGERDLTPTRLVDHMATRLSEPFLDPSRRPPCRNLNHYIEAQVHGRVSLREDVEFLVADPSFPGTECGDLLEALCREYEISLHWHSGFALALDGVPSDFRGPTMPALAKRVATGSHLDANAIGRAVRELRSDPESFSDLGTEDDMLQELKLLWHVLVRYGRPLREFRDPQR